jgi:hypothetical protein
MSNVEVAGLTAILPEAGAPPGRRENTAARAVLPEERGRNTDVEKEKVATAPPNSADKPEILLVPGRVNNDDSTDRTSCLTAPGHDFHQIISNRTCNTEVSNSSFYALRSDQECSPEEKTLSHDICILSSVAIPNACLVIGLSGMCFGIDVFNAVANDSMNFYGNLLLLASVVTGCLFFNI